MKKNRPTLSWTSPEQQNYAIQYHSEDELSISCNELHGLVGVIQNIAVESRLDLFVDDHCSKKLYDQYLINCQHESAPYVWQVLKEVIETCYPAHDKPLEEQYKDLASQYQINELRSAQSIDHLIDNIDSQGVNIHAVLRHASRKLKTWSRFGLIDPLHNDIYNIAPKLERLTSNLLDWQEQLSDIIKQKQNILDSILEQYPESRRNQLLKAINTSNNKNEQWNTQTNRLAGIIEAIISARILKNSDTSLTNNYVQQLSLANEYLSNIEYALFWLEEQSSYIEYNSWMKSISGIQKETAINAIDRIQNDAMVKVIKLRLWLKNKISAFPTDEEIQSECYEGLDQDLLRLNIALKEANTHSAGGLLLLYQDGLYTLSTDKKLIPQKLHDLTHANILPSQALNTSSLNKQSALLANLLSAYDENTYIYQTKEYNIVSLLLPYYHEQLTSYLTPLNAKKIEYQQIQTTLKESILTQDRKRILVINEGMLDPYAYESMIYQHQLIRAMEKTGYRIISIDSKALCSGYTFHELMDAHIG